MKTLILSAALVAAIGCSTDTRSNLSQDQQSEKESKKEISEVFLLEELNQLLSKEKLVETAAQAKFVSKVREPLLVKSVEESSLFDRIGLKASDEILKMETWGYSKSTPSSDAKWQSKITHTPIQRKDDLILGLVYRVRETGNLAGLVKISVLRQDQKKVVYLHFVDAKNLLVDDLKELPSEKLQPILTTLELWNIPSVRRNGPIRLVYE